MKFAVRFYTKTGNTKRLAEAVAKELGVEALWKDFQRTRLEKL